MASYIVRDDWYGTYLPYFSDDDSKLASDSDYRCPLLRYSIPTLQPNAVQSSNFAR